MELHLGPCQPWAVLQDTDFAVVSQRARWPVWWISAHEYRGRCSQACTCRRQTPIAVGSPRSQVTSGHCWRTCVVVANNVQTWSNGLDDRGQPLVTMGGGALPLPMPTQPETLTATRVATKANSTFFIGVPLFFHAHARHTFVLRCTVSRLPNPMVHGSGDSRALQRGLCL